MLGKGSNMTSFETITTTSCNLETISLLSTDQEIGHLSEPAYKWLAKRTISAPTGKLSGPRWLSWYSDLLRAGQSGD